MKLEEIPMAITEGLAEYTDEKIQQISDAVKKHTKEAYKEITEDSPVRKNVPRSGIVRVNGVIKDNYQPGAYKKGWISVVRQYDNRTQGYVRNKTNYQLTHLLELGHDLKRKGKVYGKAKAYPHIVQNQNKAREELNKEIEKIIKE